VKGFGKEKLSLNQKKEKGFNKIYANSRGCFAPPAPFLLKKTERTSFTCGDRFKFCGKQSFYCAGFF